MSQRDPKTPIRYPGRLSFAPFKESVRWGLGAFWSVMGLAVFALNGGAGKLRNERSLGVAAFSLGLLLLGCLAVLLSRKLQLKLLEPDRVDDYTPYPFLMMGAVSGLLGGKFLYDLLERL